MHVFCRNFGERTIAGDAGFGPGAVAAAAACGVPGLGVLDLAPDPAAAAGEDCRDDPDRDHGDEEDGGRCPHDGKLFHFCNEGCTVPGA